MWVLRDVGMVNLKVCLVPGCHEAQWTAEELDYNEGGEKESGREGGRKEGIES